MRSRGAQVPEEQQHQHHHRQPVRPPRATAPVPSSSSSTTAATRSRFRFTFSHGDTVQLRRHNQPSKPHNSFLNLASTSVTTWNGHCRNLNSDYRLPRRRKKNQQTPQQQSNSRPAEWTPPSRPAAEARTANIQQHQTKGCGTTEEGMLEDLNHHPHRASPDAATSCDLERDFVAAMCRQLQNEVISSGKRPLDQLDDDDDADAHCRVAGNRNKSPRRSGDDGEDLLPNGTHHHPPSSQEDRDPQDQPRQDDDMICGSTDSLIPALGPDLSVDCLVRCSRSDFGTLALLNKGFRSLVRSGDIYRMRRRKGIIEHWVYFSCHGLQWDAFDPHRSRWMQLPPIPQDDCFMCSDKESLAVGTDLLVFGKVVHAHVVLRYSLLTNTWSPGKDMNTPRCLFGSASLGEIAIVAGGCSSLGTVYASAELYDSERQVWETLPDMNEPRRMCSGFFMDGRFYVVGGMGVNARPLTSGEEYDLNTRTWRVIPDMFPALFGGATGAPPLVAVVSNQLYAADYSAKVLRRYAKKTNTWITLGPLPERSVTTNGWGFAFRACGESLVVIGGPRTVSGGIIEFSSWVPTTPTGDDDDGGSSSPPPPPPQWDLIGRKPSGCFVYNCAVMGC